jgi:SAM-dependent methyltransferase
MKQPTAQPLKARERHELRKHTFDANPGLYDRSRPGYPDQLFDDMVRLAHVPARGRVLEIGPGTGQATLPLARRGLEVLALELGASMARACRRNLAAFPMVTVLNTAFEDWPVETGAFDLVVSASAFHWVNPRIGFSHAARALKDSGYLALVWHFREDQADPLSLELHEVYESIGLKPWRARPPEQRIARQLQAVERSGRFGPVTVRRYPGARDYSTPDYIALLRTMSDHAILPAETRRRLFAGIRRVFARHGDVFTRRFISTLLLAKRRETAACL